MNKYLRIFFSAGASFGLFLGVFYTFQHQNATSGIIGGVFAGVLFGLAMAALSYAADRKLRVNGIATGNASTRQVLVFEIERSIHDLFSICKESLCAVKSCKLTQENQEKGTIHGKVSISWKSFGELIQVSLKPVEAHKTLIEIESKPTLPTTLVDYGKNKENVEKIAEYLRRRSGRELTDHA